MDVLSDVLKSVRLCGSVFFTAELSSPWALESPHRDLLARAAMPRADQVLLFHILTEGHCIVECDSTRVAMESGDVAVFPDGRAHTMRSDASAQVTRLDHLAWDAAAADAPADGVPRVMFGGGGRVSRFLCGYLNCSQRFGPLFDALPTLLVVRHRGNYRRLETLDSVGRGFAEVPRGPGAWLATTLAFTIAEANAARPGNTAILGRLAEIMFVEIVREYLQQPWTRESGWLAALEDPQVGQALRLLHGSPARSWTVNALAHEVAVSRSALAQRFTRLTGQSPMKYLACWRMQLAKELLRDRDDNIQVIAERLGYESEPAFSRAFKKLTGRPPAAWRRTAAQLSAGG